MNLPKKVTALRFFITLGYFVVLALVIEGACVSPECRQLSLDAALALFLLAAISDVLDGYLARKYHEETNFGRVADPFVDKILVCGSFILLLSFRELDGILASWMVVVIVSREFVSPNIGTVLESRNLQFGATFWGKQQMLLQCIAIVGSLLYIAHLSRFDWSLAVVRAIVWVTVVSTVVSGVVYLRGAMKLLRGGGW